MPKVKRLGSGRGDSEGQVSLTLPTLNPALQLKISIHSPGRKGVYQAHQ